VNVLFVPTLGLDVSLLERLASSVDYPIKWKVAYNNGPIGALEDFRNRHPDWIVKEPAVGNRGAAGSWNDCAKMFPGESAWLLMNEDAYFLPGYLSDICNCVRSFPDAPVVYLNNSNAYYCFVWTKRALAEVGTFDENFWPAYYEDCDYKIRLELIGFTGFNYALQELPPLPHGKPRTGGTDYSAMLQGCGLLNRAYWKRKWGNSDYYSHVYQTPYNDQRLTAKDWEWMPQHRADMWPLWRTFMENPKLYD
jgi:hypothetical protein